MLWHPTKIASASSDRSGRDMRGSVNSLIKRAGASRRQKDIREWTYGHSSQSGWQQRSTQLGADRTYARARYTTLRRVREAHVGGEGGRPVGLRTGYSPPCNRPTLSELPSTVDGNRTEDRTDSVAGCPQCLIQQAQGLVTLLQNQPRPLTRPTSRSGLKCGPLSTKQFSSATGRTHRVCHVLETAAAYAK